MGLQAHMSLNTCSAFEAVVQCAHLEEPPLYMRALQNWQESSGLPSLQHLRGRSLPPLPHLPLILVCPMDLVILCYPGAEA